MCIFYSVDSDTRGFQPDYLVFPRPLSCFNSGCVVTSSRGLYAIPADAALLIGRMHMKEFAAMLSGLSKFINLGLSCPLVIIFMSSVEQTILCHGHEQLRL